MAWERRGNSWYYYRSIRRNGRVVKQYLGNGPAAQEAARLDAERREKREAERQRIAAEEAGAAEAEALTRQFEEDISLLREAALLAAGYHRQNYGPWRRRRVSETHQLEDPEFQARQGEG